MALAGWNQASDLPDPVRALIRSGLLGPSLLAPSTVDYRPIALDVIEKPDKYEILADIPGVGEEDINISVDGDALTISVDSEATKSEVKEEEGVRVHRQERSVTFVSRTIRLPPSANLDKIDAQYDSGVLRITIPKKEAASSQKTIKVGKGKQGEQGQQQTEGKQK